MELPRTQYSQEFREQLVKFFKEGGLTLRFPLFFVFQWVNSFMLSVHPDVE